MENNYLLLEENVTFLGRKDRFHLIRQAKIPEKTLDYLSKKLQNLTIEILGDFTGNIISLMNRGLLEGWCWQTTESAIVFLEDTDYIERGNLKFHQYKDYWHSWICFKFEDEEFVFDPCLQILIEKPVYYHIFEIFPEGKVTAKDVRDELIYSITHPKKKDYLSEESENFMKKFFEKYLSERQKNETCISGNDDVTSPMYRNTTGYTAEIENGTKKKLLAHFYLNG